METKQVCARLSALTGARAKVFSGKSCAIFSVGFFHASPTI
ncbi:MAG TPA: hypothetical protein VGB76_15665 [Pyrinomonadaceae bacterium]